MNLNIKYGALQAAYWMLYCIGYGFVTFYLQSFGYAAGEIGIVTAVFGVVAAVVQTRIGTLADRSSRWDWRALLSVLPVITAAVVAAMGMCANKLATGVLFGCFLVCVASMTPLVNAACFAYQGKGISLDFGKARGVGSLAYAAISYVLGLLTRSFGTLPVVIAGLASCLAILLIVRVMPETTMSVPPADKVSSGLDTDVSATGETSGSSKGFLAKYPGFVLMLVGLVMLLSFHNGINTYMLQIVQNVGGDSATMGTAISIAAICELPVMFGFAWISKRFSTKNLLVVCGIAYFARALIILASGSVAGVFAQQVLQMFSFAIYASASVYYTNEVMRPEDKVTGQALMSGVATVGSVIGNLLCGWVLQYQGIHTMFEVLLALTVIGTVVVFAASRGKAAAAEKTLA